MHESSVVLPQPEAPIATTKSPSRIARLTFASASTVPAFDGVADAEVADVERRHEVERRTEKRRRGHENPAPPRGGLGVGAVYFIAPCANAGLTFLL